MVCIYCGHDTQVTNSRLQKTRNQVWRRRHCQQCASDFTTLEKPDLPTALAVIHSNDYRPFLRDKLFLSVYESLKHRKTALSDATALTDTIVGQLYPCIKNGGIKRGQIIATASEVLHRYDKAAASHYNAYHP
ncbi:MAG TPA: hypothetical protein VM124_01695 [Candidatus Limnocylindrales bacterium]|nr:hypothetical protein [Candidatus Limnocylindrales bacterium]